MPRNNRDSMAIKGDTMTIGQKIIYFVTDRSSSIEGVRTIASAEASMMQGLSQIESPERRRAAVDLMVENAK